MTSKPKFTFDDYLLHKPSALKCTVIGIHEKGPDLKEPKYRVRIIGDITTYVTESELEKVG